MTRRLWHIANVLILALVLLSGRLVYWQQVRGRDLQPVALDPVAAAAYYADNANNPDLNLDAMTVGTLPQPVIQRTQAMLAAFSRGNILDAKGFSLAYDVALDDGTFGRQYVEPSLAHAVGYVSGLRTGVTGVEYSLNAELLGLNRLDGRARQWLHQPVRGNDVHLTVGTQLQRLVADILGNKAGAIVVMDGRTGAILSMVSAPWFDPNRIVEAGYSQELMDLCDGGLDCRSVFFNRATQGWYSPGSLWHTVALAAALETEQATLETSFDFGPLLSDERGRPHYDYQAGGLVIRDYNHPEPSLMLAQAYMVSADAAFARLGHEMNGRDLIEYGNRFGFSGVATLADAAGDAPPIEVEATPGRLAIDAAALRQNEGLRAATAAGQGELLASPLSMALVVAAVVNEGQIPRPHLVQQVVSPTGRVLDEEVVATWKEDVIEPATAGLIRQLMIEAIAGRFQPLASAPEAVIGGTAATVEAGEPLAPHAWFAGFVQMKEQPIIIVVLLENGGDGWLAAAPLFMQVAEAITQVP